VTSAGTLFDAGAVVDRRRRRFVPAAAPGRGGRRSAFEGRQLHYKVKQRRDFHGQRLVVFGGGDSALDWATELAPKAASLALVHRRAEFRGAPASVARMRALEAEGKLQFIEGVAHALRASDSHLHGVDVKRADGSLQSLDADQLLVFFGLAPKLGPDRRVGTGTRQARDQGRHREIPVEHPRRVRDRRHQHLSWQEKADPVGLPRSGAGAFAVQHHLYPAKKQFLQYTTTSPAMQKRLGVAAG
jgi:thioredoxin reductase (NADPH)